MTYPPEVLNEDYDYNGDYDYRIDNGTIPVQEQAHA
jgi:hypothetical protein